VTSIRLAQLDDAAALAALNREFNEAAMTPNQIAACLRSGRRTEVVLVAAVDGDVAGFACMQLLRSMCYERPWAELTELYVRGAHRRRGIGRALVQEGERLARKKGTQEIVVRTGGNNIPGKRFYQAMSYMSRADLTLQKRLG
jgi:predicted N-acetyltransferase YhbS